MKVKKPILLIQDNPGGLNQKQGQNPIVHCRFVGFPPLFGAKNASKFLKMPMFPYKMDTLQFYHIHHCCNLFFFYPNCAKLKICHQDRGGKYLWKNCTTKKHDFVNGALFAPSFQHNCLLKWHFVLSALTKAQKLLLFLLRLGSLSGFPKSLSIIGAFALDLVYSCSLAYRVRI